MIVSLLCTNSWSVRAAITLFGIAMFARLATSACAQSIDSGKAKVIAYLGEQRITDREVDFQLGRNQFEGGQVEGGFEKCTVDTGSAPFNSPSDRFAETGFADDASP